MFLEIHYIFSICLFQDAEVGSNLVRLASTATAVKEKDGNIYCQPETLCEGETRPLNIWRCTSFVLIQDSKSDLTTIIMAYKSTCYKSNFS